MRGVLYLHLGGTLAVPLAVSLMTLRRWHQGAVAIVTELSGPGEETARMIAADPRIRAQVIPAVEVLGRAHEWYLVKPTLPALTPFSQTAYLDSDTLVAGPIDELWPDESTGEVVLTRRFSGLTTELKMRLRAKAWRKIDRRRSHRAADRNYPWPAINLGAMAWSKASQPFCDEWRRLALANPVHSCDEMAAQLCYPDFAHRLLDCRYNANVSFNLNDPDVRIWHGPRSQLWKVLGDGRGVWVPRFREALAGNWGNVSRLPDAGWWKQLVRLRG